MMESEMSKIKCCTLYFSIESTMICKYSPKVRLEIFYYRVLFVEELFILSESKAVSEHGNDTGSLIKRLDNMEVT